MARIAVVDDETDIREMLADYLGGLGHEVATAGDGAELEALLAAGPAPDLFVLDLNLPGRDGLEIARDLRARLDPGIVMLTAAGGLVDRVVGLEVGADDYLAKPFDLAELAARIAAVLRRRPGGAPAAGPRFGGFTFDLRDFCLRDAGGAAVDLADGGGPSGGLRHPSRPGAEPGRTDAARPAPGRRELRPQHRQPHRPAATQARTEPGLSRADQDRPRRRLCLSRLTPVRPEGRRRGQGPRNHATGGAQFRKNPTSPGIPPGKLMISAFSR